MDTIDERSIPFIGAIHLDYIPMLKTFLELNNLKITDFFISQYRNIYFESLDGLTGLIISFTNDSYLEKLDSLKSSHHIKFIKELVNYGELNNIKVLIKINEITIGDILLSLKLFITKLLNITIEEIDFIKYEESHKDYIKNYYKYKNSKHSVYDFREMNEIEMFSMFYFWEIKLMSNFSKKKNISIYDTGTCLAHLPLLLSQLSKEDLFGLQISKIYASDIKFHEFARKSAQKTIQKSKKNLNYLYFS